MQKSHDLIFKCLNILAWIVFVALCIEAGALLVNFIYSMFKPSIIQNLYQKLDLSSVYAKSKWFYYAIYSFLLTFSIIKAYLFYIMIKLSSALNLTKPFTTYVSKKISQISYYTLSIGILNYIGQETVKNLQQKGYVLHNISQFWVDSKSFIVMAGIVYVIAVIFEKGIQLQSETDLTI